MFKMLEESNTDIISHIYPHKMYIFLFPQCLTTSYYYCCLKQLSLNFSRR